MLWGKEEEKKEAEVLKERIGRLMITVIVFIRNFFLQQSVSQSSRSR